MAYVYIHKRKDTDDIFYIGIGADNQGDYKRAFWRYRRNRYWHHVVNKHGYEVEITHKDIIWEEACVIEKYLISFYGRKDLKLGSLVNLTDGGDGAVGMIHSSETRNKISEIQKGKKLTDDVKKKISEGNKGKYVPDSVREKLSIANTGKKQSAETLSKLSIIRKKRKMSNDHKILFTESGNTVRRKIILNVETGIFYYGSIDAANSINKKRTTLNSMLTGQNKNRTSLIYV